MKYAGLIALLLLAALVTWDIVLRIDDTEQPLAFPSKTAEDMHDLDVFHERFWQIVQGDKEENHKPEHAPAIAAVGYETVKGIVANRGRANDALRQAWDTIEIIRSIHGDDGPETTFVYERFFGAGGPLRGQLAEVDVLLPVLDSAWNTAKVPDRLALLSMYGKKDALCAYINSQFDRCALFSQYSFKAGDLDTCQGYLDRMEAIMTLPWIETLHQTKEKRIGTSDLDYLEHQHDLVKARVLILDQQYSEAKAHLEAMGFPNSPDEDPIAAELWMPLYAGWHLADRGGGHDESLRTWATRYLAHAEQKSKSSTSPSTRIDWKKKADEARATLETLGPGE